MILVLYSFVLKDNMALIYIFLKLIKPIIEKILYLNPITIIPVNVTGWYFFPVTINYINFYYFAIKCIITSIKLFNNLEKIKFIENQLNLDNWSQWAQYLYNYS